MRILLAEDEKALSKAIVKIFEKNNYSVDAVYDGEDALAYLEAGSYDVAVLDIMMPKMDGITVLKKVRAEGNRIPILMLTAKSEIEDRVLGLDSGANDYLPKPFDSEVLVSRIKAVLRRTKPTAAPAVAALVHGEDFMVGSHRVDMKRHLLVDSKGREEALSVREIQLLRCLTAHPGEVAMREQLLSELWGYSFTGTTRALDQVILHLRRKLGKDAVRIETVHGAGYRYVL